MKMEPPGGSHRHRPWVVIGGEFHSQSGKAEHHSPISAHQENGSSSFTALLELPPNQAMELLVPHSTDDSAAAAITENPSLSISAPPHLSLPSFPSNAAVIGDGETKLSLLPNSDRKLMANLVSLKLEDAGSDSDPKSNSYPNRIVERKLHYSAKRKEREKTEKAGSHKCKKTANEEGAEKPPYVHVRARRGQATDSHSLAERARREKINAKMKLLQEMVPGCNKISGTALVLDEIINHVQSLQRQIEILSMRLATINPTTNISFETLMNDEDGSALDSNISGMVMPSNWHEEQQMHKNGLGYKQFWHTNDFHQLNLRREDEHPDFTMPENTPLIYGSSGNSAPLQMNQVKMEL